MIVFLFLLRELLFILAAPLTSLVGLAAFSSWWTAAIFVAGLAGFALFAIRRHDKHSRSEAFDDKISPERMNKALEWLMEE